MDALELLDLIKKGESSTVQFKVRVNDAYKVGTEMVAFSNANGGKIVVGIDDETGEIKGLNYEEIQAANQLLSNAASDNIKPPIYIITETITVNEDNVLVATIAEGASKPFMDNKGIIWTKNGSDKRRVIAKEEIARLLQSSGNLYADEMPLNGTTVNDIDESKFLNYFTKNWGETPDELGLPLIKAFENTYTIKDDKLTLGGLLFFGKAPQKFKPAFCVKAVAYYGNDIEGTEYRDSEDIKGTIPQMFDNTMSFLKRNLKRVQQGQSFNSEGMLEVSETALEELLQNALIHRDYLINSPIRLFIFDNRIEIISPGKLPNNLTIDHIKFGSSVIRNNLLTSFCSKIMKYRGIGSGIRRAIKAFPQIEFINDIDRELFSVILSRSSD
jgi:predicted HTH transcriptional regulator